MISIIIASVDARLLSKIKSNIEATIQVPYELIVFENSSGERGICSIYNEGARKAQFDLLCFVHEDVHFETSGWGVKIATAFASNNKLGLLGVAGGTYKSMAPSSWFCYDGYPWLNQISVIQQFKYDTGRQTVDHSLGHKTNTQKRVATLDGVLLCSRKSIILKYPFDESLLTGFHGYDIDISLTIGQHYQVIATSQILITHFSDGHYGINWLESTLLVHRKWKHIFPVKTEPLNHKQQKFLEKRNMRFFLHLAKRIGLSKGRQLQVLWDSRIYRLLGWVAFFKLHVELFKNRTYRL